MDLLSAKLKRKESTVWATVNVFTTLTSLEFRVFQYKSHKYAI